LADQVTILGASGALGFGLALRLGHAGVNVVVGSRDAERGKAAGAEIGVGGGANEDVVRGADLVVLATKSNAALDTARELVFQQRTGGPDRAFEGR
jgi:predicted dinucleotide-binding enzyme